jgi:hypothetical protein
MWCLPNVLLVPEMCGSPVFMFLLGGEVWLFLLSLQFGLPIAAVAALFNR